MYPSPVLPNASNAPSYAAQPQTQYGVQIPSTNSFNPSQVPQQQFQSQPSPQVWTPPPAQLSTDISSTSQHQNPYFYPQPVTGNEWNDNNGSTTFRRSPAATTASQPNQLASLYSNPLIQMGMQQYGAQLNNQVRSGMGGLFDYISPNALKYYFHVNNGYVINKLKILLLPFTHKNWKRERVDGGSEAEPLQHPHASLPALYQTPANDVNAPDLYIPMMAFFTYVLVLSYANAMNGSFNPDRLGVTASFACVLLAIEVAVIHLGFYLISATGAPRIIDCVAYLSYKFVHCILAMLLGLAFGSLVLVCAVFVLGSMDGLFVMRTMKRALSGSSDGSGQSNTMKWNYFLILIGVAQIVIVGILCWGTIQ